MSVADAVCTGFDDVRRRHGQVYVIVSPPRCASTALARVFWEQPSVGYYCHEPFEVTYYQGQGLDAVLDKLERPLDLTERYKPDVSGARALVIKEMPYQVGDNIELLLGLATAPVVFLIRDPRQNIQSRIEKKILGGQSPTFPLRECGWELLSSQIATCARLRVPHLLVDTNDLRNSPDAVLGQMFRALELPYERAMIEWRPAANISLDNLGGEHDHLYRRVLRSARLQPADEPIPSVESFPEEGGVRDHVRRCLEIYGALRESPRLIRA